MIMLKDLKVGSVIILQKCKHKFLNGGKATILSIDVVDDNIKVQNHNIKLVSIIGKKNIASIV